MKVDLERVAFLSFECLTTQKRLPCNIFNFIFDSERKKIKENKKTLRNQALESLRNNNEDYNSLYVYLVFVASYAIEDFFYQDHELINLISEKTYKRKLFFKYRQDVLSLLSLALYRFSFKSAPTVISTAVKGYLNEKELQDPSVKLISSSFSFYRSSVNLVAIGLIQNESIFYANVFDFRMILTTLKSVLNSNKDYIELEETNRLIFHFLRTVKNDKIKNQSSFLLQFAKNFSEENTLSSGLYNFCFIRAFVSIDYKLIPKEEFIELFKYFGSIQDYIDRIILGFTAQSSFDGLDLFLDNDLFPKNTVNSCARYHVLNLFISRRNFVEAHKTIKRILELEEIENNSYPCFCYFKEDSYVLHRVKTYLKDNNLTSKAYERYEFLKTIGEI